MDQIRDYVDERQKAWCIHCSAPLATRRVNRDHVPSKALLRKPYPVNLPSVNVCVACNGSFAQDEEYAVAFLGSVLAGSTDPSNPDNFASGILARSPHLKMRIERAKTRYKTIGGETRALWKPELERINRVVLKNARGHAFFECGEPMLDEPSRIEVVPLMALTGGDRDGFEKVGMEAVWPEVGSRMMMRMLTGQICRMVGSSFRKVCIDTRYPIATDWW